MATRKTLSILREVEKTYLLLEENFDSIYAQLTAKKQRQEFRDRYSAARDAYWLAAENQLAANNSLVRSIRKDLNTANAALLTDLRSIKDTRAFLERTTDAIKLAAALSALAAA